MFLSSLLYVDDVFDMTASLDDRLKAHQQALLFSKENNLGLSGTKCFCMAINNRGELLDPMVIDGEKVVIPVHELTYLDDVFNDMGNNDSLIKDRVKRAVKAIISIASLIEEANLGIYEVSVWLLLYRSLFLPTVLFNSETWSRLRETDVQQLRLVQLKFLKKIFRLASSTPNSFLLLEFGVLPIEGEIHKRQLMYLHKILQRDKDDPVSQMLSNLMAFDVKGEENWWTQVRPLLQVYGLPEDVEVIKLLSKSTFKTMVNKGVEQVMLQKLQTECSSLKKTVDLKYDQLGMQEYLRVLYPSQSKLILKSRCKTLDIKLHNTYKFDDELCRRCGVCPESLEHIINCKQIEKVQVCVLEAGEISDLVSVQLSRVASRIQNFLEEMEKGRGTLESED